MTVNTKKTKLIAAVLSVVMIASLFAGFGLGAEDAYADTPPSSPAYTPGSGSTGDPYVTFEFFESNGETPKAGTLTPKCTSPGSNLEYSTNGTTWVNIASGSVIPSATKVYVRGSGRNTLFTSGSDLSNAWSTSAPKLKVSGNLNTLLDYNAPPLTLGVNAFANMFFNCPLIEAPELPATTLAENCYYGMFSHCASLVDAPALPATTLTKRCYSAMFDNDIALVNAPELPATTLAEDCYSAMFRNCLAMPKAPELPATTLVKSCYSSMFYACRKLETAPDLPATVLAELCYAAMFRECTNLKNISVSFTNWNSAGNSTDYWVYGVSGSGTFVKPLSLAGETGDSRIPDGWDFEPSDCVAFSFYEDDGITPTSATLTPKYTSPGSSLEYSTDGLTWAGIASDTATASAEKIYVRGTGRNALSISWNESNVWVTTAPKMKVSGNINTILDYSNPPDTLGAFAFAHMFQGCDALIKAPKLPATTLNESCYYSMFSGTSLVSAPELPAETLAATCYLSMFENCSALVTAPKLSAVTLDIGCYMSMFSNCTSLVNAPDLPATSLDSYCYHNMFYNCSNLNYISVGFTNWNDHGVPMEDWVYGVSETGTFIKPSGLPVERGTTRIPDGWNIEVSDCTTFSFFGEDGTTPMAGTLTPKYNAPGASLQYSTDGGTWTNIASGDATPSSEVVYVRGTGGSNTLYNYKDMENAWTTTASKMKVSGNLNTLLDYNSPPSALGDYAFSMMFYDCDALIAVPELPATTLSEHCYDSMFSGAAALADAPVLPAIILADHCYDSMFYDCSSLNAAPALPAKTLADYCYSNMFYGCSSIINAPALPATTLTDACYANMFYNCESIETPPALLATTLTYSCYSNMFYNCRSLSVAPELPATTLAVRCYYAMFQNCESLLVAPDLPATTLTDYCYPYMFAGCTELNYISVNFADWNSALHSTTNWVQDVSGSGTFKKPIGLADIKGDSRIPTGWNEETSDCVTFSFYEADGTTAEAATLTPKYTSSPQYPLEYSTDGLNWTDIASGTSTVSAEKIYIRGGTVRSALFTGASNTNNPWTTTATKMKVSGNINTLLNYSNPPTSVGNNAFAYMFYNCTAIVEAPELPATRVSQSSYNSMFRGCTALLEAPELPATTLDRNSYTSMFADCTSLEEAPYLPATALTRDCYSSMFSGCTNLKNISVNFTAWGSNGATTGWVTGVADTGTFVKPAGLAIEIGNDRIPTGWNAPSLSAITSVYLNPGYAENTSSTAVATGEGTIVYSVDSDNDSSGVLIDDATGVITILTGLPAGTYTIGIKATTEYGYDTKDFIINVSDAPVLDAISPFDLGVGYAENTSRAAVATGDGTIAYSVDSDNDSSGVLIDDTTGVITIPTGLSAGTYTVGIKATTEYGYDTKDFVITVHGGPVLNAISSIYLATGYAENTSRTAVATGTGTIVYSTYSDATSSGVFINGTTGVITIPSGLGAGDYTVGIKAATEYGFNTTNLIIHVTLSDTDILQKAAEDIADKASNNDAFEADGSKVDSEASAKKFVSDSIANLIPDGGTATVNTIEYILPVPGTADNPAGTPGYYKFTVTIDKGNGTPVTTGVLTLVIRPVRYVEIDKTPATARYDVTFNANDGKVSGKAKIIQKYDEKTKLGKLPTAKKTGYKFKGWYTKKTGGEKITANTTVTKSVTYYAHYAKLVKITFNANKGKVNKKAKIISKLAKSEKFGKLPKATKFGYKFKGWYTKKTGGKRITSKSVIKGKKTYYAHYKKLSHKALVNSITGKKVTIKGDSYSVKAIRIRSGVTNSKVIGYVKIGSPVKLLGWKDVKGSNDWYKIKYKGITGWVHAPGIKFAESATL